MRPAVPAISVAGVPGDSSPAVPSVSEPPALATSKNRLFALCVPTNTRLLWSTSTRSPPVTGKSVTKSMALPVPIRLVVPATPPLLPSSEAVMVLVDA